MFLTITASGIVLQIKQPIQGGGITNWNGITNLNSITNFKSAIHFEGISTFDGWNNYNEINPSQPSYSI